MTREDLKQCIYNDDTWGCPNYSCNKPNENGLDIDSCWICAERQLAEYEQRIRDEVIKEIIGELSKCYPNWWSSHSMEESEIMMSYRSFCRILNKVKETESDEI